jgi:hypothetical protein
MLYSNPTNRIRENSNFTSHSRQRSTDQGLTLQLKEARRTLNKLYIPETLALLSKAFHVLEKMDFRS